MPRWSTAMTSKSRASAGISRRHAYHVSGQPCTSSSGGPSPPMTACWRSSPVSMNRLVNVSVNPGGRFGAPETEPGPSGKDSGAEGELTRISFAMPIANAYFPRHMTLCVTRPPHSRKTKLEGIHTRLNRPCSRRAHALQRPPGGPTGSPDLSDDPCHLVVAKRAHRGRAYVSSRRQGQEKRCRSFIVCKLGDRDQVVGPDRPVEILELAAHGSGGTTCFSRP